MTIEINMWRKNSQFIPVGSEFYICQSHGRILIDSPMLLIPQGAKRVALFPTSSFSQKNWI